MNAYADDTKATLDWVASIVDHDEYYEDCSLRVKTKKDQFGCISTWWVNWSTGKQTLFLTLRNPTDDDETIDLSGSLDTRGTVRMAFNVLNIATKEVIDPKTHELQDPVPEWPKVGDFAVVDMDNPRFMDVVEIQQVYKGGNRWRVCFARRDGDGADILLDTFLENSKTYRTKILGHKD